jgi:hypothetical protein
MKSGFCFAAVVLFASCNSPQKEVRDDETVSPEESLGSGFDPASFESFLRLENYLSAAKIPESDLQVIDSSCAIFVNPNGRQITEMREAYGEEGLASLTDDNGYFQSNARRILDSVSVKIMDADKRFIKLKGQDGRSWILDLRKEGAPEWNLIIFNTRREPEIVPAIDLTWNRVVGYFDKTN